jgi:phosphatidylglycerol:prolipoprotein diacylglycerol transferase
MTTMVWDLDPELVKIGSISIRWYSVWIAIGLILSHHVFRHIWHKEGRRAEEADLVIIVAVFFSVVGARLAHCFFYQPDYFLAHPMDILKLWQGGLASHGGFIGLFCGLALLLRVFKNVSFLYLADRFMISAGIVSISLRTGNLFNSEILGKPSDAPWAIVFSRVDQVPRHPSQVYEIISYTFILFVLIRIYLRPRLRLKPGLIFGSGLTLYSVFRIIIEFTKEGQSELDHEWAFTIGQWLSVPFAVVGLLLLSGVGERIPKWFDRSFKQSE